MTWTLPLLFAALAAAQSPMPYSGEAPAASPAPTVSSAPAVAASTETVVVASTAGARVAVEEKPKLARPIHAVIHPDAKDWEPLSLRAGGDPGQAETRATLRLVRVKGKYKGTPSKATAFARLHKAREDRWLVVSVFPKALARRRAHLEVRLRLVEGYVEEAQAALVAISDRGTGAGAGLDSFELRAKGIAFEEDSPASGQILVSALDPRPSRSAENSGTLKLAAFADRDAGLADVSWAVSGLPALK